MSTSMALVKMIQIDGWHLIEEPDAEPTIEDIELAAKLGFTRERDIRKLIERLRSDGLLSDSDLRATVARRQIGTSNAFQSFTTYRLTETGALLVISKSDTKVANAILRQVIEVYVAYRRGRLVPQAITTEIAHGPRLGDVPSLKAEMSALCCMAARASGQSLRRIHGFIRRICKVPGIHHVAIVYWDKIKSILHDLALGKLLITPARRALPPANRKQLDMWGPS